MKCPMIIKEAVENLKELEQKELIRRAGMRKAVVGSLAGGTLGGLGYAALIKALRSLGTPLGGAISVGTGALLGGTFGYTKGRLSRIRKLRENKD